MQEMWHGIEHSCVLWGVPHKGESQLDDGVGDC